jgi:hypothetical protein
MMTPGITELIIIVGIFGTLVGLGLAVWAAIDAAMKPDEAWRSAGQNKLAWVIVPLLSGLLCGVLGAIAAGIYLFSVRPKVVTHAHPDGMQR